MNWLPLRDRCTAFPRGRPPGPDPRAGRSRPRWSSCTGRRRQDCTYWPSVSKVGYPVRLRRCGRGSYSRPWRASSAAATADRAPEWHTVTTARPAGSSPARRRTHGILPVSGIPG